MTDIELLKLRIRELIRVVWRRGDLARLGDYWTEDCVNHADPAGEPGLEALTRYHRGFGEFFGDFADIEIEIVGQIGEDDRVVTHIVTHARHVPKDRRVLLETIRIDRFRGDRIAEHWSVADVAGLQRQLAD